MVSINRKLNLVIPLLRNDETYLYVHATPIRPETFEKYYLVLSRAFSSLAQNGLDPRSGPSVAALLLKEVSQQTARGGGMNWWDGPDGVGGEAGLNAEIIRLSNALVSTPDKGWTSMPLNNALNQGLMDDEEKSEVLNLLTFFTVVSHVAPRVDRERLVKGMAAIYELQTTYSNATEFSTSLKTSTTEEPIGESDPA